jgi:exo-1,4-beta-D-glucosaminidase
LPKVKLQMSSTSGKAAPAPGQPKGQAATTVTLTNPTKSLAFFVRLKVTQGKGGDEVLPVLWEDNYLSLLPGETRVVTARYRQADLRGKRPEVELQGWNVGAGINTR